MIGVQPDPGHAVARVPRARDRQGALRRRSDRARRRRETATSRRTRSSSSSRTSSRSTRSSPTTTRSIRRSRRCSTRPTTTSSSEPSMAFGDVDAAFAAADRVVRGDHRVHRHHPVPMECRGTIASWDADSRAAHDPHLDAVAAHAADAPARPDRRADGAHPRARRRRRRWLRAEERRRPRGRRGGRRVHRPRPSGQVDRGPTRAPGHRRARARGDGRARGGDHRRRSAPRRADGRQGQRGRLPVRPVPGLDAGVLDRGLLPGADSRSRARRARHAPSSATRRRTSSYRGPWATGDFLRERLVDIVARELGIDPSRSAAATTSHRGRPPLAMLTGQPFLGRHDHRVRRAGGAARRLGRLPGAPARRRAPRAATSASASRPTSRRRPGPRSPGSGRRTRSATRPSHLSIDDDGRPVIITRQQPHGQGHETTLAQVAADELGVRFEDVDRALRRHRHHAGGAGRHRRQPGRDHGERCRAARVAAS